MFGLKIVKKRVYEILETDNKALKAYKAESLLTLEKMTDVQNQLVKNFDSLLEKYKTLEAEYTRITDRDAQGRFVKNEITEGK